MEPKSEYQNLELNGVKYRLIVEFSTLTGDLWRAYGFLRQKDSYQQVFQDAAASEAEAKSKAHQWAFAHSGETAHECAGSCEPWSRTYSDAVVLWSVAEGLRTKRLAKA